MTEANSLSPDAASALQLWLDDPGVGLKLAARDWKAAFATYKYLEIQAPPPFVKFGRPLSEATIAAITSGGLYIDGEQSAFNTADPYGDASIHTIPTDTPYCRLKIAHNHFNHTVPEQDLNTIDPVNNLKVLEDEGVIGKLYPIQISMHGYIPDWHRVFAQLVPAVLEQLRNRSVDGVLLVPV